MKKITIEIKEDGVVSFNSEGLTNIETYGLLGHYKNIVELEMIQKSISK